MNRVGAIIRWSTRCSTRQTECRDVHAAMRTTDASRDTTEAGWMDSKTSLFGYRTLVMPLYLGGQKSGFRREVCTQNNAAAMVQYRNEKHCDSTKFQCMHPCKLFTSANAGHCGRPSVICLLRAVHFISLKAHDTQHPCPGVLPGCFLAASPLGQQNASCSEILRSSKSMIAGWERAWPQQDLMTAWDRCSQDLSS